MSQPGINGGPTEECSYCGEWEYLDNMSMVKGYPCCHNCYPLTDDDGKES